MVQFHLLGLSGSLRRSSYSTAVLRGLRDSLAPRAALEIFSRCTIDGYMCDVEILWWAKRLGFQVKEIGIDWRDDGDSRLDLVRGNWQNLRELLQIRFARPPERLARGIAPVSMESGEG